MCGAATRMRPANASSGSTNLIYWLVTEALQHLQSLACADIPTESLRPLEPSSGQFALFVFG